MHVCRLASIYSRKLVTQTQLCELNAALAGIGTRVCLTFVVFICLCLPPWLRLSTLHQGVIRTYTAFKG